ncbi:MAG: 30S ribosomal protein S14 [Planctomycetota bacterium]
MATTAWIVKQKKRDALRQKHWEKRQQLKAEGDYAGLARLPRDSSPVRGHKRCALTGRSRGYMGKFNICRHQFRDLALKGMIPGVRKSSW